MMNGYLFAGSSAASGAFNMNIVVVKHLFTMPHGVIELATAPAPSNFGNGETLCGGGSNLPRIPMVLKRLRVKESKETHDSAVAEFRAFKRLQMMQAQQRSPYVLELFFSQDCYGQGKGNNKSGSSSREFVFGMEYCPGGDLHSLLYSEAYREMLQSLRLVDVVFYLAEIVSALKYMHACSIYHGDIKPSNILISASGHLRLADFGSSQLITDNKPIVTASGTMPYCAPEILFRHAHLYQPDWWSLGVVACELMTRTTPFTEFLNVSEPMTLQAICNGDLEWIVKRVEVHCPYPSPIAADFVASLIVRDKVKRLGDANICEHRLFKGLRWDKLERAEYPAPFVPRLLHACDTYYFEEHGDDINDVNAEACDDNSFTVATQTNPVRPRSRTYCDNNNDTPYNQVSKETGWLDLPRPVVDDVGSENEGPLGCAGLFRARASTNGYGFDSEPDIMQLRDQIAYGSDFGYDNNYIQRYYGQSYDPNQGYRCGFGHNNLPGHISEVSSKRHFPGMHLVG